MSAPGLICNFRTGTVHASAVAFETPETALQAFRDAVRMLERFQRCYADGVRSEDSYRLWAAAEQAPVRMIQTSGVR